MLTKRILIIDDDPHHAETLRRGLLLLGHEWVEIAGVDEAQALLQGLRVGRYDLVVLDLSAAQQEHPRLLGQILRDEVRLPVVVISGLLTGPEVDAALLDGYPVLRKPFNAEDLQRAIASALPGWIPSGRGDQRRRRWPGE